MELLENRINSVELCELINQLRKEEKGEGAKVLRHDSLMAKIRKELETMEKLGITNHQNILEVEYTDKKGETRPCFSLNASGMRQILNSESVYVRCKTEEYITKLENQISAEERLALQVYHGGISAIEASQKLVELKTAELKPKADYYDKVLTADNCRSITEIAKDYGLSGRKLNQILNDKGVQYKTPSGQWVLYSKYDGHGYVKTQSKILYDGEVKYYTKWTAKGQKFIDDLLKK